MEESYKLFISRATTINATKTSTDTSILIRKIKSSLTLNKIQCVVQINSYNNAMLVFKNILQH